MRGLGRFGAVSCRAMSCAESREREPDGLGERTGLLVSTPKPAEADQGYWPTSGRNPGKTATSLSGSAQVVIADWPVIGPLVASHAPECALGYQLAKSRRNDEKWGPGKREHHSVALCEET